MFFRIHHASDVSWFSQSRRFCPCQQGWHWWEWVAVPERHLSAATPEDSGRTLGCVARTLDSRPCSAPDCGGLGRRPDGCKVGSGRVP